VVCRLKGGGGIPLSHYILACLVFPAPVAQGNPPSYNISLSHQINHISLPVNFLRIKVASDYSRRFISSECFPMVLWYTAGPYAYCLATCFLCQARSR
jgi:hypothetical protein